MSSRTTFGCSRRTASGPTARRPPRPRPRPRTPPAAAGPGPAPGRGVVVDDQHGPCHRLIVARAQRTRYRGYPWVPISARQHHPITGGDGEAGRPGRSRDSKAFSYRCAPAHVTRRREARQRKYWSDGRLPVQGGPTQQTSSPTVKCSLASAAARRHKTRQRFRWSAPVWWARQGLNQ
jgi:hypothetical protein